MDDILPAAQRLKHLISPKRVEVLRHLIRYSDEMIVKRVWANVCGGMGAAFGLFAALIAGGGDTSGAALGVGVCGLGLALQSYLGVFAMARDLYQAHSDWATRLFTHAQLPSRAFHSLEHWIEMLYRDFHADASRRDMISQSLFDAVESIGKEASILRTNLLDLPQFTPTWNPRAARLWLRLEDALATFTTHLDAWYYPDQSSMETPTSQDMTRTAEQVHASLVSLNDSLKDALQSSGLPAIARRPLPSVHERLQELTTSTDGACCHNTDT